MQFFKTTTNLSYDHKCCSFSDHTNVTHNLQLRYAHTCYIVFLIDLHDLILLAMLVSVQYCMSMGISFHYLQVQDQLLM